MYTCGVQIGSNEGKEYSSFIVDNHFSFLMSMLSSYWLFFFKSFHFFFESKMNSGRTCANVDLFSHFSSPPLTRDFRHNFFFFFFFFWQILYMYIYFDLSNIVDFYNVLCFLFASKCRSFPPFSFFLFSFFFLNLSRAFFTFANVHNFLYIHG